MRKQQRNYFELISLYHSRMINQKVYDVSKSRYITLYIIQYPTCFEWFEYHMSLITLALK